MKKISGVIFLLGIILIVLFVSKNTVFGQNACPEACQCALQSVGDINCDNKINLTDFEIWRKGFYNQFLATPTPETGTATPTPNQIPTATPTRTPTGGAATPTPTTPTTSGLWLPKPDQPIHWHWQLSQTFSYPRDVKPGVTVYDIDGEYTSAQTVAQLHAMGPDIKVICYIDVGVFEDYRSDAASFPDSVKGNPDQGWNGSWWLDIRQTAILKPIMEARIRDWCKAKGFDAVEPDESEVTNNDSGFPITDAQNVAYSKMIADLVHSYGMSVGLKGNNAEAASYEPFSDWSLSEQCFEYNECNVLYNSFEKKGKAVFIIEYDGTPDCTWANANHLNAAKRDLNLVGPTSNSYRYTPCVPDNRNSWQ